MTARFSLWCKVWCIGCLGLLAACAAPPAPVPDDSILLLRLAPAALGQDMVARQHLQVQARERELRLEVLLEVDAQAVRLALLDLGQIVARLQWDGARLDSATVPGWPAAVSAERILSDLQLTYWPVAAIAQALPAGWTVEAEQQTRVLRQQGQTVVTITRESPTRTRFVHAREGYSLTINSFLLKDVP